MENFIKSIKIKDLFKDLGEELEMSVICGEKFLDREIAVSNINRPGLALAGFLQKFRHNSVQVLGRGEHSFCQTLSKEQLKENLKKMLAAGPIPCMILTEGNKPMKEMQDACCRAGVPVFSTKLETSTFVGELSAYLEEKVSPTTHMHGVLVDVSGIGVLITGEAGIGKSECALELIKRGHIFVADDVVEMQRRRGNFLMGTCPEMLRYYMEVRGLGIIDVEMLFGVGAILESTKVEMIVHLAPPAKEPLDRLGVSAEKRNILGVEIPYLSVPVTPGRNLAVLIEVAALNQQLKNQGMFSAEEFSKKVLDKMKENKENKNV